jgi:DNA-binding PadR family transcriptional regulator
MNRSTAKSAPLSPATLHILLALAGGELHGYGIIQEIARHSDGHYRLGPGTLYDNLKKMIDAGMVADVPKSVPPSQDERRFYSITAKGRVSLSTEIDRLQSVVTEARLRLQDRRTRRV